MDDTYRRELQDLYSVSRVTVRKAIEGLVFKYTAKKQGIGTIVYERMAENTARLQSFTEKFAEQGFTVKTKVLEVAKIIALIELLITCR